MGCPPSPVPSGARLGSLASRHWAVLFPIVALWQLMCKGGAFCRPVLSRNDPELLCNAAIVDSEWVTLVARRGSRSSSKRKPSRVPRPESRVSGRIWPSGVSISPTSSLCPTATFLRVAPSDLPVLLGRGRGRNVPCRLTMHDKLYPPSIETADLRRQKASSVIDGVRSKGGGGERGAEWST